MSTHDHLSKMLGLSSNSPERIKRKKGGSVKNSKRERHMDGQGVGRGQPQNPLARNVNPLYNPGGHGRGLQPAERGAPLPGAGRGAPLPPPQVDPRLRDINLPNPPNLAGQPGINVLGRGRGAGRAPGRGRGNGQVPGAG